MKYILTFILTCLLSLQAICQKSEIFQMIDSVTEKEKILEFIKEFGSCSDSIKIQKYIAFPYFTARHTCNGLTPDYIYSPIIIDSSSSKYDTIFWNYEQTACGCHNPLYSFCLESINTKKIKDSLIMNKISIPEFYFNSQKNRNEYCGWLIKTYNFPLTFQNIDMSYVSFEPMGYPYGNKNGTGINVMNYGFGVIQIVKINGQYKVVWVGFLWN
jgi:hypothetical protein